MTDAISQLLYKNGYTCILESEHIFSPITGKQVTSLDTTTNGMRVDIRSITENRTNTISNGIKAKKKQRNIVPPHLEEYIPYSEGKIMVSPLHGNDELESNLRLAQTMYEIFGETVYLLPNINTKGANAHLRAEYIPQGVKEGKNADFLCVN